ncbi:MAG: dTMP kinase [Methylococcaceae bacterium]|jgi:dTMP kinase
MAQAFFITLEGGEGVGKTTNLEFIQQYLAYHCVDVLRTREPGGTPLGEQIRHLLLNSASMDSHAELLLVFSARAQHVNSLIKPALTAGRWVLCDRFTDASYAYQGGGRQLDSKVIGFLENWVQDDLQPDLTLLLDAPVEIGMARAKQRNQSDRFELEVPAFFEQVRRAYLERAAQYPERIKVIDAARPLNAVQADIARHLDGLLAANRT